MSPFDSVIFLHGSSGAGKGEVQRSLAQEFEARGFKVQYVAAGDLFREAFANPLIADRIKKGFFEDTLGAILPGLQDTWQEFTAEWKQTHGKSILVLDGFMRRGRFMNAEGTMIPSQLEQIAEALCQISDGDSSSIFKRLRQALHIVVDVLPEDAEQHMRWRMLKEVAEIRTEAMYLNMERKLQGDDTYIVSECLQQIELLSGLRQTPEELKDKVPKLLDILRSKGLTVRLRDDDLMPESRLRRVSNFVSRKENGGGRVIYEPGFAVRALEQDLGFTYDSKHGSFESYRDNCKVVENGASKGVDFEQFKRKCQEMAEELFDDLEAKRELSFGWIEGQKRGKEGF